MVVLHEPLGFRLPRSLKVLSVGGCQTQALSPAPWRLVLFALFSPLFSSFRNRLRYFSYFFIADSVVLLSKALTLNFKKLVSNTCYLEKY